MYQTKILNALLRQDFASFIHKCFNTINPGIEFLSNWHIELIAEYLEQTRQGKINRLIINMPPRALKSVCISVAWPAWLLGHDPSFRIMAASYSQALSTKHSLDCRMILESEWFNSLFPECIISKKQNQKNKFMTNKHGFRYATSVGGSATGEGGDFLIIDDPHNPSHINSRIRRQKVHQWYDQTFSTRLNNKKNGVIILVMQRLHADDLAGYLLEKAPQLWTHLRLPAIAEEEHRLITAKRTYIIRAGDILHPAREDQQQLLNMADELGSLNFAAQYQQNPMADNGNMLNINDIKFYDAVPSQFEQIILSWDTAIKVNQAADFSVCTCWGVIGKKYYLINMLRQKFDYPDLKKAALKLMSQFNPNLVLVEDKASGQSLIQDLSLEFPGKIKAIKPNKDKITRFAATIPLFQSGNVLLPLSELSWKNICVNEIMTFPSSRNDDIVDSISQFLNYVKYALRPNNARIREM